MGNITPQEISNGTRIVINNDVWTIVDFQHVKPGKGGAFVRSKMKSITTGRVIDKTFKGTEKIESADCESHKMQYLYKENEDFVFMDLDTYEQANVHPDVVGDLSNYLKEGDEVSTVWWNGKPIGLDIPAKVVLAIIDTMPGEKGNTVTQATKPATLETGLVVQVPLFVNQTDKIRVDTRTGKYVERA